MSQRKKTNSARVNLTISLAFHAVLIGALFFFASREGMLGKRLKEITVSLAPKEKKPEPPKPKPAEPKAEPPKTVEQPKTAPPPRVETAAVPPPPVDQAPAAAPPSVSLPEFQFGDGAKEVQTTSDANELYKGLIERALRSHWNRSDDIQDDNYVAEIELTVEPSGRLADWHWRKGSGNKRWDDSVKQALAQTKTINRSPPKGFPEKFVVRFDVANEATVPVLEVSSR